VTIDMKPQPEPSTQEVLAGLVERVTYHNAENGFCVLRAKARGHRDVVTVVGHAATIAAGEWITASGEWINDRTHGQQFKALAPLSVAGYQRMVARAGVAAGFPSSSTATCSGTAPATSWPMTATTSALSSTTSGTAR
jgi:hypothetical protein